MTAVETPPPTDRRCPRCGAAMTEEQEWCLNCGAAVGTRVVAAPGWRAPLVLAGVIVALAAIAVAVAIIQLADDTDQVASAPPAATQAAPTPTPAATTPTPDPAFTPDPAATPDATETPAATPSATPDASGSGTAEWPSGKTGWTVVLSSDGSQSTAEDKAAGFAADGISGVGVLKSDDFSSLKSGFWVVFSGQYDTQSEASDALDGIDAKDAYIRHIVPD